MSVQSYDGAGLEVLDPAECLLLLGSVPLGRIVYTDQALPAVQPVNFLVHDGAVIIRVRAGSTLAAATRNAVVAFEADDFDPDYRRGWSVVVIGHAQEVTDQASYELLAELPLRPWAPGRRDHLIRVPLDIVRGRRIPPPAQRPDQPRSTS